MKDMTDEEFIEQFNAGKQFEDEWCEKLGELTNSIPTCSNERLQEMIGIAVKVDCYYGPQSQFLELCAEEAGRRLVASGPIKLVIPKEQMDTIKEELKKPCQLVLLENDEAGHVREVRKVHPPTEYDDLSCHTTWLMVGFNPGTFDRAVYDTGVPSSQPPPKVVV